MKNSHIVSGKHALVTGASGGIGRMIALQLADNGCVVFLTGRNENELQNLAQEMGRQCAGFVAGDLATEDGCNAIATAAKKACGQIDLLVNSAGIFPIASVMDTTTDMFDQCFAINVRAPFYLSKAVLPAMQKEKWGRIVNIGSSSAYAGFAKTGVYCASKHALLGLSRALHAEYKGDNIRVFCVSPGSVKTEMGKQVRGQDYETFIEPEDVAKYVLFLLSLDGNMISEEVRLNRMFIQ